MSNNFNAKTRRCLALLMIGLTLGLNLVATNTHAAMVSTQSHIYAEQQHYQQQQLISALESQELRQQLLDMGVEPDVVTERVASLTSAELSLLNERLAEEPAGAGVLGALVVVFVVFVITDAWCATDLFTFVKCIK